MGSKAPDLSQLFSQIKDLSNVKLPWWKYGILNDSSSSDRIFNQGRSFLLLKALNEGLILKNLDFNSDSLERSQFNIEIKPIYDKIKSCLNPRFIHNDIFNGDETLLVDENSICFVTSFGEQISHLQFATVDESLYQDLCKMLKTK